MNSILDLKPGQVLDNTKLCELFLCSPQGGMRRSLKTNSLVLITSHVSSIYSDRWVGAIFHYTGMGMKGNQSLNFQQNKTLAESASNGISLYLFEVFKEKEYTFAGQVQLAGEPYQETQPDDDGQERLVWMFPLKLTSGTPPLLKESTFFEIVAKREREVRKLPLAELERRAKAAPREPGVREVVSKRFERNADVSRLAKERAKGLCELCEAPAPFNDRDGNPFLETHHVIWLSEGGEDSVENTVALCPNCHRKMHVVNDKGDVETVQSKVKL